MNYNRDINMRSILILSIASLFLAFSSYFTVSAQTISSNVFQQLGTVQQQDIDNIQRLEKEKRAIRDYENRKLEEEKKKQNKKREKAEEPAKPSELKTKGVYIDKIEIPESEILTKEEIADVVKDYEKTNLTMADIKELVEKLNQLYLDKGYVSARAYLPEQTVEDGLLKVAIMEGKIGQVKIQGNRWTKESHILGQLNLNEGEIFNIQKLEDNILIYNRYNDGIALKGDLNPGEKDGTTNVDIKAEEIAPFHITAVADNSGRKTIGEYRFGLLAQHDSLFGYRDRLSAGIYANKYSKTPFVDYNIPVNEYDGRIGISFSHNEAEVGHGAYRDFNIESRSQNYSIYYTHPFIRKLHDELNATASYTFKRAVTSFDGEDVTEDKIPELKVGMNYRHDSENGVWYFAQSISYAAPWYQNNIDYWKFEGSATRLHDFGHRILGLFRGNYQYVPQDVIPYTDQLSAGGIGTVRGYSQGLLSAKSGYQLSAEIYFPISPKEFNINIANKSYRIDEYVRPFVFTDYAALYPYKGPNGEGFDNSDVLLSSGAGLRVQLPHGIVFKVAFGVPLRHNKYETKSGGAWCLELSYSPDVNKFFRK